VRELIESSNAACTSVPIGSVRAARIDAADGEAGTELRSRPTIESVTAVEAVAGIKVVSGAAAVSDVETVSGVGAVSIVATVTVSGTGRLAVSPATAPVSRARVAAVSRTGAGAESGNEVTFVSGAYPLMVVSS